MANVVKFKINGLSSALNNVYTRVTDLSRNELYSGESLNSDSSGNVELNMGNSGSIGDGCLVYVDDYSAGNELTFKSTAGYGVIQTDGVVSTEYNYVLNGTDNDLRLSPTVSMAIGDKLTISYFAQSAAFTASRVLVCRDTNFGSMVTFNTNGTLSTSKCTVKIDGVDYVGGGLYPTDSARHTIELTITEALSISLIGGRWISVGSTLDSWFKGAVSHIEFTRAAGDITIPLNNLSQGAVQSSTVGSVNATITNYNAASWVEVDAPDTPQIDGTLRVWLQSGQSLSIGTYDAAYSRIHTGLLSDAYLFTGIPSTSFGGNAATTSNVASLVPYVEQYRETHGYAGINKLKTLLNDGSKFLFSPAGQGGATISNLSSGSVPFANAQLQIAAMNERAAEINKDLSIEFLNWIHGESHYQSDQATYIAELRPLHDSYISLANAETGQTTLPMLLDQSGVGYAHEIAKASFKYALNNADAHMVMPNYMLNRKYYNTEDDLTHLNPSGYVIKGEYHGIAAHKLITTGSFKCLQPESYDIVGNTIEITMHVPVLPLVIDTTTLPAAPSYGFSYTPPSGAVIYPTVTVSGSKIILDIGTPPLTGGKIDCGYTLADQANTFNTRLPCTNIRDSQNISSEISGYTLHNWLVQFDHTL